MTPLDYALWGSLGVATVATAYCGIVLAVEVFRQLREAKKLGTVKVAECPPDRDTIPITVETKNLDYSKIEPRVNTRYGGWA